MSRMHFYQLIQKNTDQIFLYFAEEKRRIFALRQIVARGVNCLD